MSTASTLKIGGGILLGSIAASYAFLIHKAQQLIVLPTPRAFQLTDRTAVITFRLVIKNPTGTRMDIKSPFLRIYRNGILIAHSKADATITRITNDSEVTLDGLKIDIPYEHLATLGFDIINLLTGINKPIVESTKNLAGNTTGENKTLPQLEIQTRINMYGWGFLPMWTTQKKLLELSELEKILPWKS